MLGDIEVIEVPHTNPPLAGYPKQVPFIHDVKEDSIDSVVKLANHVAKYLEGSSTLIVSSYKTLGYTLEDFTTATGLDFSFRHKIRLNSLDKPVEF